MDEPIPQSVILALANGGKVAAALLGDVKRMIAHPKTLSNREVSVLVEVFSEASMALSDCLSKYYQDRTAARQKRDAKKKAEEDEARRNAARMLPYRPEP